VFIIISARVYHHQRAKSSATKGFHTQPPPRCLVCVSSYVVLTTGLPVQWHVMRHGSVSLLQAALQFFLGLNLIVCMWEFVLFFEMDLIEKKSRFYEKEFKGRPLDIAVNTFTLDVHLGNVFSSELWAELWACYSAFDASYADRQSFGYFIDVGNGFSTLIPTVVLSLGMTAHGGKASGAFDLPVSARTLGVVGLLFFYQMFYGTCVYFFSFVRNNRCDRLQC
jgi:hypothetical protein